MSNTIVLDGINLCSDPEMRFTPSGTAVCKLRAADNRKWTTADGKAEEATCFVDVDCWGDLAENVAASLHKGDRVVVTGRLEEDVWEDADGNKRSKHKVHAFEVSPSLRWAEAVVSKNERKSNGNRPPDNTTRTRPTTATAAARAVPVPNDEEPF